MLSELKKIIKRNKAIFRLWIASHFLKERFPAFFMPDDVYIKWQYRKEMGKKLDLKNPKSFNEKIQWLKLNSRDERLGICSDKYRVRDYVKSRLGEEILVKLYSVYERVEDIVPEDLSDSFVLKVTHGSGQNIICKNKKDMDWKHVFGLLKIYMSNNHYYRGRELAYKNITPRIICEEYLEENGRSPIDYKFYCFNGQPQFVDVHRDRFGDHRRNSYDLDWNLLPFEMNSVPHFHEEFPRPSFFEKMCRIAEQLAQGFILVRVDFYNINEKIIFGELTFYPGNGMLKFSPDVFDNVLGSYLQLPGTAS